MTNLRKIHKNNEINSNERGSVLWFILIGLVLIGLLTALLSRSGSNVDQSGDTEQQRIKINQMLRYVKGIETAIQQMKLRGVSESDIDFSHGVDTSPADGTDDHSNSTCTNNSCKVFHVEGGGLSYQAPPVGISSSTDYEITGRLRVQQIGNTSESDLILVLNNVNLSYCLQINRMLGITNPGGMPPKDNANSNAEPYFYLNNAQYVNSNEINSTDLNGFPTACYDGFDSGTNPAEGDYRFYHVLMPR